MKKLWRVEVKDVLYVAAETKEDAEDYARYEISYSEFRPCYKATDDITAGVVLGDNWGISFKPWNEDNKTISDYINQN